LKAEQSTGFIYRLIEDDPFLAHFSDQEKHYDNGYPKLTMDRDRYNDHQGKTYKGFFVSRIDSEELIKYKEETVIKEKDGKQVEENMINIAINLGYANLHPETLRAAVFTESIRYIHKNNFYLSERIFDGKEGVKHEFLSLKNANQREKANLKPAQELSLIPKLSAEKIFNALKAKNKRDKVKLINRTRTLITSLKYWKRAWENNEKDIETNGETTDLKLEKEGLQNVFNNTMHNGENYFKVKISEKEMCQVMKISENPYLWFLRLVVKKK